jgi:SCY1-like protein 1
MLDSGFEQAVSWGLYQVIKGLEFLHTNSLYHGNICLDSIFLVESGDWKLGSLGFVTQFPLGQEGMNFKRFYSYLDPKYKPPEFVGQRWEMVESYPNGIDCWSMACLLYEIFEGKFEKSAELSQAPKIPKSLQTVYRRLLNKSPDQRMPIGKILTSTFFESSFVTTQLFLENISLKDQTETTVFLEKLSSNIGEYPKATCKFRILPFLFKSIKFNGQSAAILPILEIGKILDEVESKELFIPDILDCFAITDKMVRLSLLNNLGMIISKLTDDQIQEKVYPPMSKGFIDNSAQIREATVKSMIVMSSKLKPVTLQEVFMFLFKLQADSEPAIRTNSIIAVGKMIPYYSEQMRSEKIIPCLARSLRDPFLHSRISVIKTFFATKEYFTVQDRATKIIPLLAPLIVDPDKSIRENALNCVYAILQDLGPIVTDETFKKGVQEEVTETGYISWALSSVSNIGKKIINKDVKEDVKEEVKDRPQEYKPPPREKVVEEAYKKEEAKKKEVAKDTDWDDTDWNAIMNSKPVEAPVVKTKTTKSKSPDDDGWGDVNMIMAKPLKASKPLVSHKVVTPVVTQTRQTDDWGWDAPKKSTTPTTKSMKLETKNKNDWEDF